MNKFRGFESERTRRKTLFPLFRNLQIRMNKSQNRRAHIKSAKMLPVCLAIILLVGIVVYAVYSMVISGWEQTVSISSFTVYLNGKALVRDSEQGSEGSITSKELNLAKNHEAEIVLDVSADGYANSRFCVPFQIELSFDDADGDGDIDDDDKYLAKAIEVYAYNENNEYVYKGMLDKLLGTDGYKIGDINPETVNGSPVYKATVGINGSVTYKYRLVYSQGAGDDYENKTFKILVKAQHTTHTYTNSFYYVYSANDFTDAITAINNGTEPLTIVLMNNIVLPELGTGQTYDINKKAGISFNGCTLTLGSSLNMTWSGTYSANDEEFYLTLSAPVSDGYSPLQVLHESRLNILAQNDIIRISDSLKDSTLISVDTISVSALKTHLEASLNQFCKTPVPSNSQTIDFSQYYKYYLIKKHLDDSLLMSVTETDIISEISSEGVCTVNSEFNRNFTTTQYVQFSLGGVNQFSGNMTFLGSNAFSIARRLADTVPETITSSLFFPVYDTSTGAHITWISKNKKIIDSKGDFLPMGYTVLDSYRDQPVDIGLIVETSAGEKYTAVITRTAEILTLEERTNLIYSFPKLVLDKDNVSRESLDINTGINTLMPDFDKFGFEYENGYNPITVEVNTTIPSGETVNVNYSTNDGGFYVSPDTSNPSTVLNCNYRPQSIGALIVPAEVEFKYLKGIDDTTPTSFEISRDILVIGTNATETRDDATVTLQPSFTSNPYTEGEGYSFLAEGSYDNGQVLVDYMLPVSGEGEYNWDDKIEIVNGIYIEDSNGLFIRNQDGTFSLASTSSPGTRYSRKSLVIVKPEFVDTVTRTAPIIAKLVENTAPSSNEYSNSIYLNAPGQSYAEDWTGSAKTYSQETVNDVTSDIEYNLSLVVEGLYHQRATEIADAFMYTKLLTYYDYNSDGYISVNEALREPRSPANESGYEYLNFKGLRINNIKGIEYFRNVKGLSFDSVDATNYNSVIDLSNLSELYQLKYLSVKNNQVADISSLAYLDELEYLDLSNPLSTVNINNITDVSPIRYLTNVKHLNLSSNANLSDIKALTDYSSLEYLNVNSTGLAGDFQQYYIVLIYNNCTDNGIQILKDGSDSAFDPGDDLCYAANALRNLRIIDSTFNTLILPTETEWNDNTYQLRWLSGNTNYLDFLDSDGHSSTTVGNTNPTSSWIIHTPYTDTTVHIRLYITANDGTSYIAVAREFDINIMQISGNANMTYIEGKDGKLHVAATLVPDSILLGELFNKFNTNQTTTDFINIYQDSNGEYTLTGTGDPVKTISQDKIVTQDEISEASSDALFDLSSKGITDIHGIEEFSEGIVTLDLAENVLTNADISPLSGLSELKNLWLTGQTYDFSQLSEYSETAFDGAEISGTNGYGRGLTSLENLSVFGCGGLDNDDVLSGLYQVYLLNKDVKIYFTGRYDGSTENTSLIWSPYQLPMAKYLNYLPSVINYVTITNAADWHTTCLYKDESGALRVNASFEGGVYYYTFRFYDIRTITFTVTECGSTISAGSSTLGASIKAVDKSFDDSPAQNITGFKYGTLVGYTDTAFSMLTVSGNENADINANVGRNEPVSANHYIEHMVDFNHNIKLRIGEVNYSLNELFPGRTLLTSVMASYSPTAGIWVVNTDNQKVRLVKDTALSTGNTEVFILGNNKIFINAAKTLASTGLFLTGGKSAIEGLQYTNVEILTINREAILGDGTWLENLTTLYIGYSAVDLSTLTIPLTNLTSFIIGRYDVANTARACWDVNMYDVSEYNISDTSSTIYRLISGLNPEGVNYNDIISGRKTPEDNDYIGASLQKEAFFNTNSTGTEAEDLYAALRQIARSKDANNHYYFYLNYLPNVENFEITWTNVDDWTGLLAYMFKNDEAPASTDTSYYNGYYDNNSLNEITIFGRKEKNNNFRTYNSNGGIAEPIIRKLYYASSSYERATINPQTDPITLSGFPTYKIGTISDSTSDAIYHPEDITFGGTVISGWHSSQFTHLSNYKDYYSSDGKYAAGDRLDRTAATEAKEFLSKITDFGVKMNDLANPDTPVYHYQSVSQTVPTGGTVYLPEKTGAFMFGTATNTEFPRDYSINWSKLSTSDNSNDIPSLVQNGYYEYTYSPEYDSYMVFVGTVTVGDTSKTIYYPVLFKGTTSYTSTSPDNYTYSATSVSYGIIKDLQLRLLVYLKLNKTPQINPTSLTGSFAFTVDNTYTSYVNGIVTLDGFGIFTGITSIDNNGGVLSYLNDASDLENLRGLTFLRLKNSLITDVSWVRSLTSLTTLDLSGNMIKDTYSGTTTHFPASLTSLDLSNNISIRSEDITSMSTLSNLVTLKIVNTVASHEEQMLTGVRSILSAGTPRSLNLYLESAGGITVDSAKIQTAINYISGASASPDYNNLVQAAGKTANAYTYNTANAWNPAAFGAGLTVNIVNDSIIDHSNNTFRTLNNKTSKVIDYLYGFAVSVSLGTVNGVSFDDKIVIYKTGYLTNSGAVTDYSLVFSGVNIAHSDIDNELYAYFLKNYECTISSVNKTLTFSGTFTVKSSTSSLLCIKSLKGLEKITGLTEININGTLSNPVRIDSLGFTQSSSSVTKLTLGVYTDSRASALSSISNLNSMTELNLWTSGIDYYDTAELANTISNISSVTTLYINNVNYYQSHTTGIESDRYMLSAGGSGYFGNKAITGYTFFGSVTVTHAEGSLNYPLRSRLSKVYTASLWWGADSLTVKYSPDHLATEDTPAITDYLDKNIGSIMNITDLYKYICDISKSTSSKRAVLPTEIHLTDLSGSDPNYSFRTVEFTFTLPKKFNFYGVEKAINWSAAIDGTDNANVIFTDSGNFYTVTFTEENINVHADGDKLTLTATSEGVNIVHQIKIYIDTPPVYYGTESSNNYITAFYLEMEDGEIVSANRFFDSYRLLYWMYNVKKFGGTFKSTAVARIEPAGLGGKYVGKYLTLPAGTPYFSYEQICSLNEILIGTGDSVEKGIGATSLKGMELFENLKKITITQGYDTSIEPLRNMQLEYFKYYNSNTNDSNTIIQDWTPLYNSRNTLKEFYYIINGASIDTAVYTEDLSFLMGFTALETVEIGKTINESLEQTPSFKYMLAWNVINNKQLTFKYKNSTLYNNGTASATSGITSDILAAARILQTFTALNNADFDYINNFELIPKPNVSIDTPNLILPGYIDYGGAIYPIEWTTESSFADIEYVTAGGADVTLANGEIDYFAPTAINNRWRITISNRSAIYLSNIHIIARILVDGSIYERMFTINCSDNNIYPSILLADGYATYTLATGKFSEVAGYSTLYSITNSEKTLVLNSGSVGQAVYVNVNGVMTRIYHSLDSSFFTPLSGYYTNLENDNTNLSSISMADARNKLSAYDHITLGQWTYLTFTQDKALMNNVIIGLTEAATPKSINYYGSYTSNPNPTEWSSGNNITLAAPVKTGFMFNGWYTDSEFVNPITEISGETFGEGVTSITLYPRFLSETNVINYVIPKVIDGTAVSSTNSNPINLASPGNPINLSNLTDITMGYTFDGWYKEQTYVNEITQITKDSFDNPEIMTVYAKISAAPMRINYDRSGIDYNTDNPTVFYNTSNDVTLKYEMVTSGINAGKVISGWYTGQNGTGIQYTALTQENFESGTELTLYPKYEDGNYYFALTTYFVVGKYSEKTNFIAKTFYYKMNAEGSNFTVDKLQLKSSDQHYSIVKLADSMLPTGRTDSTWFYENGTIANGGDIESLCRSNKLSAQPDSPLSLGSYKVTLNENDNNSVNYTQPEVSPNVYRDVYTITGATANTSNAITGSDSTNWGSSDITAPNELYTMVYLYTTSGDKDIYALWLSKTDPLKMSRITFRVIGSKSNAQNTYYSHQDSNTANSIICNLSNFGSYGTCNAAAGNTESNGIFLIFCPQRDFTIPNASNANHISNFNYVDIGYCHETDTNFKLKNYNDLYKAVE